MARRFRFALLWLMLLALPLQGYAAAVALHCGQAPLGAAQQTGSAVAPGDAMLADVADVADVSNRASAAAPACHGGQAPHHSGTVSKLKCSACAACCFGAALAPPALTFESIPPVTLPVTFIVVAVLGFFTDGPDRPPRHSPG